MCTSFTFFFTEEPALGANIFQFEACPNQVIFIQNEKKQTNSKNKTKNQSKEQWLHQQRLLKLYKLNFVYMDTNLENYEKIKLWWKIMFILSMNLDQ